MPVFPAVPAVADAEFGLDLPVAHLLIDPDGLVAQRGVVSAVEEPFDGTQGLERWSSQALIA